MGGGNNTGIRAGGGRYAFLLNSDAWVERRRARAARRVRRRTPAGRGRRAAPPQPGRLAPALRPRRPDALAARDRVPVPAQARAEDRRAERLLRRRLPPRRAAPRRVAPGRGAPRAARGDRRGRALRRELLHVQRGDRLARPLPGGRVGGVVHARRRGRPPRRRLARRAALQREPPRDPPLPRQAQGAARGRAGAAAPALVAAGPRARLPRRARQAYRDGASFLASGDVQALLR